MKKNIVLLVWLWTGFALSVQAQSVKASIALINETLESIGWYEYGQKVEYVSTCYLTNTVYYKNHGTREVYHFPLKELRSTVEYDDKLVTFQCLGNKTCIQSIYQNRTFSDWLNKAYFVLEFNNREAAKDLAETMSHLIKNCGKELI